MAFYPGSIKGISVFLRRETRGRANITTYSKLYWLQYKTWSKIHFLRFVTNAKGVTQNKLWIVVHINHSYLYALWKAPYLSQLRHKIITIISQRLQNFWTTLLLSQATKVQWVKMRRQSDYVMHHRPTDRVGECTMTIRFTERLPKSIALTDCHKPQKCVE